MEDTARLSWPIMELDESIGRTALNIEQVHSKRMGVTSAILMAI